MDIWLGIGKLKPSVIYDHSDDNSDLFNIYVRVRTSRAFNYLQSH